MSQPIVILGVITAYFAVWMLVSYISSKGADSSTFYSGNRKMPWPVVAIAMIGAPISGVTFISVPGMVMTKGFSYLQMCLGFIVGYLVIAWVLIPVYYRLNIISIYEFLQKRFGQRSYHTGAWLFFVSKLLGISVRFLTVCLVIQLLVFDPLGIPYVCSVLVGLVLVWASTFRGGVKSVIWGDVLKSVCLISCILLTLGFVGSNLGISVGDLSRRVFSHESSRILFLDDPSDSRYFWKQFVAGIFLVIAMTGLDQDMMQRTLACRNPRDSRKNLVTASLMQCVVIGILLVLGVVMTIFMESSGEALPEKSDSLFATVAFHSGIPLAVGVLFVVGLVSATYSSVASALTSMTTTMTVDILGQAGSKGKGEESALKRKRTLTHAAIAVAMALIVIFFYCLKNDDAISMVYTLVSYTDGPILGLFLFGILTKRQVRERWLPACCVLAPVLSGVIQWWAARYLGYHIGFELLLLNSGLTFLGLWGLSEAREEARTPVEA